MITARHFETAEQEPGCIPDPLYNAHYLSEIYFKAEPRYAGVYSVPVLWDKQVSSRFFKSELWAAADDVSLHRPRL